MEEDYICKVVLSDNFVKLSQDGTPYESKCNVRSETIYVADGPCQVSLCHKEGRNSLFVNLRTKEKMTAGYSHGLQVTSIVPLSTTTSHL